MSEVEEVEGEEIEKEKPIRTGFVFDERVMLHEDTEGTSGIPESPERLKCVVERLVSSGMLSKCIQVPGRVATKNQILLCHEAKYVDDLMNHRLKTCFGDYFINEDTPLAATLALGGCLSLVDAVCNDKVDNALGLGRPGGHHALKNRPMGFCFFAHTAIATKYANRIYGKRVLIVDWDVHHGNGTQVALEGEDDDDVLFISIQRNFYPFTGFNENIGPKGNMINICFDQPFGDEEIMTTFQEIVMPVSKEYKPDLILVTNGYDAVVKDETGGCHVNPETYGILTSQLMSISKNVILIGATGYHNEQSAECAYGCLNVLLGNRPSQKFKNRSFPYTEVSNHIHRENIKDVLKIHAMKGRWKCFEKYKDLKVSKKKDSEKEFKKFLVKEFGNTAPEPVSKSPVSRKDPKDENPEKKATRSVFYRKKRRKRE